MEKLHIDFFKKTYIIKEKKQYMEDKKELEGYRTDVQVGGNREYKDTLFRKIFGSEENKKYLLSLYNAINDTDYKNPEELEIVTM